MKTLNIGIIIILFTAFTMVSCEQKFEADALEIISLSYEPENPVVGDFIIFSVEVNADNAVI